MESFNPAREDSSYPLPQPNRRATCLFLHLCAAGLAARMCPHLGQTRGKKGKSEQPFSQRGKMQESPSFFFPRWQPANTRCTFRTRLHSSLSSSKGCSAAGGGDPCPIPPALKLPQPLRGSAGHRAAPDKRGFPAGSAGGSAVPLGKSHAIARCA